MNRLELLCYLRHQQSLRHSYRTQTTILNYLKNTNIHLKLFEGHKREKKKKK